MPDRVRMLEKTSLSVLFAKAVRVASSDRAAFRNASINMSVMAPMRALRGASSCSVMASLAQNRQYERKQTIRLIYI